MKKFIFLIIMLGLFVQGYAEPIYNPQDIEKWLKIEFTYKFMIPDRQQTIQETLARKTGDCSDFALLAQTKLKDIAIKSDIVIIKFKDLKIRHAICVFKENGLFNFFSNQELTETKYKTIKELLDNYYFGWERFEVKNVS